MAALTINAMLSNNTGTATRSCALSASTEHKIAARTLFLGKRERDQSSRAAAGRRRVARRGASAAIARFRRRDEQKLAPVQLVHRRRSAAHGSERELVQ